MTHAAMTRRRFLRRASGLLVAGVALAAAEAKGGALLPRGAGAEGEALHWCGHPWGPMHDAIYSSTSAPDFVHAVVNRESSFDAGATNPQSGAAGICQFMWDCWYEGEARFGISGSPYDWRAALAMMDAYLRAGEAWRWNCNGAPGCADV